MSKPNRRRFKIQEMRAQACDALGIEPDFEIEFEPAIDSETGTETEPETIIIPHPLFLPDDVQAKVNDAGDDPIAMAKAVLGEDDHAKLIANGGNSNDVVLAWASMRKNVTGTLPGGNPTR